MTDNEVYYARAEAAVLEGLSETQNSVAAPYLRRIVDEWLGEADEEDDLERDDLFEIGLTDLLENLEGRDNDEIVSSLQVAALKPDVQRSAGRAFDLAVEVADGRTLRNAAATEATQLEQRIESLIPQVRALGDEERSRLLMRELADARMELRYVLDEREGAISLRLNRHING